MFQCAMFAAQRYISDSSLLCDKSMPMYRKPMLVKAWFPYGRNGRKNTVMMFLSGQFIIVYTCKPHINHK